MLRRLCRTHRGGAVDETLLFRKTVTEFATRICDGPPLLFITPSGNGLNG